jgi:hypothetical protein
LSDGNDFSFETIEKNRNTYYQQQLANEIMIQMTAMITILTSALNIHLYIGQNVIMNTSAVFMSLETKSIQSLSNKLVKQVGNAQILLPTNFNLNISNNRTISIRVCFFFLFK